MKTYYVNFDDLNKGVFAVSLVADPAMEGTFIKLSKNNNFIELSTLELKEINPEQRILMGVALIPDKPIFRIAENGDKFNIVFPRETIKKAAHMFMKNGFQQNSTIEHKTKLSGVSFVESWIIEDPKKDKSAVHGFDYPAGSWMLSMKIDDDNVWNDYVKTGKITGFSIDGDFSLTEVNTKPIIEMSKDPKKVSAAIKNFMTALFVTALSKQNLANGSVLEAEAFEAGQEVFIVTDENTVALPVGEYEMEDGKILVVTEEGIIAEIKDKPAEEETIEMSGDIKEAFKQFAASLAAVYDKRFTALETKITQEVKKRETLEVALSKTPGASKTGAVPPAAAEAPKRGTSAKQNIYNGL